MTRQRYNKEESLTRIVRIFEGKALSTDTPETITGEKMNEEEALSDMAELLAGSLPNETMQVPTGFDFSNYMASNSDTDTGTSTTKAVTPAGLEHNIATTRLPSNAEMIAESSNARLVTPAKLAYIQDAWGQLYTYTGTATLTGLTALTDTLITGSFHNEYCDGVGVLINPDNHGQLRITKNGTYRIDWHIDIVGSPDITYAVTPYLNSGSVKQAVGGCKPSASGTATNMLGSGFVYVSGSNVCLDLRVNCGQTGWMRIVDAQLCAQRVSKLK